MIRELNIENAYAISGGGNKVLEEMIALYQLSQRFRPHIVAGVSAGVYAGVAYSFGILPKAISYARTKLVQDQWTLKPVDDEGKLTWRGIGRILKSFFFPKKVLSVGLQNDFAIIDRLICESDYCSWKLSSAPDVLSVAVDVESGEKQVWSLKQSKSFLDFKKKIAASARIPFWTQPVEIDGKHYYDGGLRDFCPNVTLIDYLHKNNGSCRKLFSIYSKPLQSLKSRLDWNKKGLFGVLYRILDIYGYEVGVNDKRLCELICKDSNIRDYHIELPDILNGPYDNNRKRHLAMEELTISTVREFLKNV